MGNLLMLEIVISARDLASNIIRGMVARNATFFGMMQNASMLVAGGLIAIGAEANHLAADFQTNFAKITGLTGSSTDQINYYRDAILSLSPTFDMTASDAAKALYYIISAGLFPLDDAMTQARKNMDVLRYSSMSATASLADQATVADAMTSMMKSYAESNITAADAANTLTRIEIYGKAQLNQFASSLGFMMVTAHAAGITMHEAAAALSNLSQVSGGHGIRRMANDLDFLMRALLSVDDVTKRSAAQLKAMGIDDAQTFQNINMRAADMGLTFNKLSYAGMNFMQKLQYLAKLSGFEASDYNTSRYKMIAAQAALIESTKGEAAAQQWLNLQNDEGAARFMKLIGGAAGFIPALTLLQQKGATYTSILAQMNSKQDIVRAAFANMRDTANQQWKMAEIGIQNLLIVIGLQLLPVLQGLYHWIYEGANAIYNFLRTAEGMSQFKYAIMGIGIVILTFLVGPILTAIGAVLAFLAPVLLVIAAGVALGLAIRAVVQQLGGLHSILKMVQPVVQFFSGLLAKAGVILHNAFTSPQMQSALAQLRKSFLDLMPVLKLIGAILLSGLVVGFVAVVTALKVIASVLPGIVMTLSGAFREIGAGAQIIIDIFTGKWGDIGAQIKKALGGLGAAWSGLGSGIMGALNGVFDSVLGFLGLKRSQVKAFFVGIWTGLTGAVHTALNAVGNALHNAWNTIVAAVWPWLKPIVTTVGQVFGEIGGTIKQVWQSNILPAWNGIKGAFSGLGPIFQKLGVILSPIIQIVRGVAQVIGFVLVGALKLIIAPIWIVISGVAAFIGWLFKMKIVQSILSLVLATFMGLLGGVIKALGAIIGGVIRFIGSIIQIISGGIQLVVGIIQAVLGFIVDLFTGQWGKIGSDLQAAWQNIIGGVQNIFGGLGQMLLNILQTAWGIVSGFLSGFVSNFTQYFQNLWNSIVGSDGLFSKIGSGLHDAVTQWPGKIAGGLAAMLANFISWVAGIGSHLTSGMATAGTDLISGITGWIPGALSGLGQLWSNLWTTVTGWPAKLIQVGVQFVIGFINGAMSMLSWAVQNVSNLFNDVLQGAKNALGIHSPSTEMIKIAQMTAQGFIVGLASMSGAIATAAKTHLIDPLTSTVRTGTAGIGSHWNLGGSFGGIGTTPGGAGYAIGGGVPTGGPGGLRVINGTGGGAVTHIHNWSGAFPNARDARAIEEAIRKVQADDYRAAQGPGGFGLGNTGAY